MTDGAPKKTKTMPKGGSKGGTRFPRIPLGAALDYAQKLVSKTHNGPQPSSIILPGVFGSATTTGKVKASALTQYGLLEGEATAYIASQLARDIVAAPLEERQPLLNKAILNVGVFKKLYETFQSDSVTRAKIRQQALSLKVHLDSVDDCVETFVKSITSAGIGKQEGDLVILFQASSKQPVSDDSTQDESDLSAEPQNVDEEDSEEEVSDSEPLDGQTAKAAKKIGRAVVTVNLAVDSSLDTDKLKKQLALLRQFGVI